MGRCDLPGPVIQIKPAFVKMANLDGVEAIDFFYQPLAERGTEDEEGMGREAEKRIAAPGAQAAKTGKGAQSLDLVRLDVEQHDIGAFQTHFCGRNERNTHARGIGKNLSSIENLIMECNRQRSEPERARPLQQLMSGIIEMIFRIVERVNMEVDFDPLLLVLDPADARHLGHSRRRLRASPEVVALRRSTGGETNLSLLAFLRS